MKYEEMCCPDKDCKNHVEGGLGHRKWFRKHGFYWNQRLKRKIQRFRCKDCGKTFGEQTFSVDYWVKVTVDYADIQYIAGLDDETFRLFMKNVGKVNKWFRKQQSS